MLTLSDGTRVFLNAETKLKFPTEVSERRESRGAGRGGIF